jgi:serine protease inhibitor
MDELHRRAFLALVATPFVVALLEACGDDASPPAPATVGSARSNLARVAALPGAAPQAAEALNLFGTTLYRQMAVADPTGNLVLSPASIAIALTMTEAGARGTTLDEMIATLRIDDPAAIHRSMNALTASLDSLNSNAVQLSIANSLWGQADINFEPAFLDLLATEYSAGMELVDYRADPDAARAAINLWVSDETKARIPELLSPGVVTTDARLTLVNAIYLKANWAEPFVAELTADAPFTTAEDDVVQVPTMVRTAEFGYATGDGWQAVEMPYADSSLAMLIFVPEAGFLPIFEDIFLVTDATQYLEPRQVELRIPRFDIASTFSLADHLRSLGMTTAFADDADFTGITTDEPLHLSAVVHQANITVGEEGTEAAAATAVIADAGAAAPEGEPVVLVIDRPFVFALRDRATEAILFLGRVADPRA